MSRRAFPLAAVALVALLSGCSSWLAKKDERACPRIEVVSDSIARLLRPAVHS